MEVMRSALPSCFPSKSNSFPSLQCQAVLLRFLKVECRPQFSKPATLKVNAAAGKGFGKVIDKKQKRGDKAGHRICPCGGGDQQLEYVKCCKPYHDGEAVEADATTLMKARFSAYANGLVDYIVKTTHPQNPDFHGAEKLAADVQATCSSVLFTKLEILDSNNISESEAFVTFKVIYLLRNGGRGDKKFLEEKSLFLLERGRWLYKEKIPMGQAFEAV